MIQRGDITKARHIFWATNYLLSSSSNVQLSPIFRMIKMRIYLHNIQIKIGHCSSYICKAYWKKAWVVVAHLVAAAVWLRVLGALIRKSNSTLATKKHNGAKNCTLKSEKKWSHTEITFSIWLPTGTCLATNSFFLLSFFSHLQEFERVTRPDFVFVFLLVYGHPVW